MLASVNWPVRALTRLLLALQLTALTAIIWPGSGPVFHAAAQETGGSADVVQSPEPPALLPAASARFTLGVAGQPVAEAWNPLRLELRDAPPATLTVQMDQGTLRSGEVPLMITLDVRGGAGVSIFEELLYLPRFATLSWRLATADRVLASGSIAGRDADERPLDLVLTSNPGAYRLPYLDAYGVNYRLVDIAAVMLPQEAAAFDGVRTLIIDGTAAAPRLEAVAAAVAGGVVVGLAGPLPQSHAELALLLDAADAVRLGAGALVYVEGGREQVVEAVSQVQVPNRPALLAATLQEPLVEPPTPLKETTLVLILAAYAIGVLLLLRLGGAPGVSAAVALAALVSLVGWQLLRPDSPRLEGGAVLALAGGELAIRLPAQEVLTMPRATITLDERARPLRAQAYRVDSDGTHITLDRWRSVLLELSPELDEAQLTLRAGEPFNAGDTTLRNLYRVGHGLQGDLAPGSSVLEPNENGSAEWAGALAPLLPEGTWLAQDDCVDGCTTWVLYPPVELVAGVGSATPQPLPVTDPFRGTPAAAEEEL